MIGKATKSIVKLIADEVGLVVVRPGAIHVELEAINVSRFLSALCVDLVIDVGANSGQYATMLRHRAHYTGPIVSCEPIPALANSLKKRAVKDAVWIIEETAVSNQRGRATLNVTADNEFSSLAAPSSLAKIHFEAETHVTNILDVQTTTLDELINRHRRRFNAKNIYVKIDTQGTEKTVLMGCKDSTELIVAFQLELSFNQLYETAWAHNDAIEALQARGFELSALFPNNAGHFPQLYEMDGIFRNTGHTAVQRLVTAQSALLRNP